MKRFAIPLAIILLILSFIALIPDGRRITALYDHPTLKEQMVGATSHTAFEANVRSTRTYVVFGDWVSPREGRVVTERQRVYKHTNVRKVH